MTPAKAIERARRDTAAGTAAPRRKSRGSGMATVYNALRSDILEMVLPPGESLDETRLSERFALSRTPVREALVKLEADGLVTTLPNRNTIVSTIDFSGLPVYFDALTLMYRLTNRAAALYHKADDLAQIHTAQHGFAEAVRAHDALRMIGTNRDFHVAIAEAGHNRYYTAWFAKLLDEGRRILRIYYSSFGDTLPERYVHEHEDIIHAIEQRDAETADQLGREHAAQIVEQTQAFLDRGFAARFPVR